MSSSTPEAAVFPPDDLSVGLPARFEHEITDAEMHAVERLSRDANGLVSYLSSREAAFVSGQVIGLTGARL